MTALERDSVNRELIGQWSDAEHLAAIRGEGGREHWIVEREGERAGYLIAYDRRASGTGIYVKRILVGEKELGTGTEALRAFLDDAFGRRAATEVWLIVRDGNDRARAVYLKLGFVPFEPAAEVAALYDRVNEAPPEKCGRMRITSPR